MPKYEVVKKGRLGTVSKIPVKAESYVIARGEGNLFILIKLRNKSRAVLNALSLTISQYDAEGALLCTTEVSNDSLEEDGLFVFPEEIAAAEGCEEIKAEVTSAGYGSYTYEKKGSGSVLDYTDIEYNPPVYDAAPRKDKLKGKNFAVMVRKYKSPILITVLTIIIFACMALFMWDHLTFLNGTDTTTIRESDVTYEFTYEDGEAVGVMATGYSGLTGVVTIPETVDGYPVVGIGANAFAGNTSIIRVTIKGEIEVGSGAFRGCTGLTKVTMSSVTQIYSYAFYGCTSLATVTIGRVTAIGASAFFGCTSLSSISCSTLTEIGNSAFYGCTSLNLVNAGNVTRVAGYAFYGCTSLYTVNLGSATIGDSAFSGCTSLSDIDFADITSIGEEAFYNCSRLTYIFSDSLSYISSYAFNNCTSLQQVIIDGEDGDTLTLGGFAFSDCTALKTFSITRQTTYLVTGRMLAGCTAIESIYLNNLYTSTADQITLASLFDYQPAETPFSVTIANLGSVTDGLCYGLNISSFTVYSLDDSQIAPEAFRGCENLTSVNLPVSLTYIGDYAFYDTAITGIDLSNVEYIGDYAFYNTAITALDISNVEYVGSYAFYNTAVTELYFNSTHYIGQYAFAQCSALVYAEFNSEVNVGSYAFYYSGLTLVVINNSFSTGNMSFYGCENLATVVDNYGLALTMNTIDYGYLVYYAQSVTTHV